MESKNKKSALYALAILLVLSFPTLADNHDSENGNNNGHEKCKKQVRKMAGLVKKYHEVTDSIKEVKSELEELKENEDSLTDTEKQEVTSLENKIKNLVQEQKIHLDALDSKSERVIKNCPD